MQTAGSMSPTRRKEKEWVLRTWLNGSAMRAAGPIATVRTASPQNAAIAGKGPGAGKGVVKKVGLQTGGEQKAYDGCAAIRHSACKLPESGTMLHCEARCYTMFHLDARSSRKCPRRNTG